ncbi:putative Gnk2-like domain-containing protein [Helianthus annuus]|nr:putative Gnk2-like domain-containing protein [Helianthus annuus]KAJ0674381.1 putative Gnk2-like domain-containing protein [Helianthus annuus]
MLQQAISLLFLILSFMISILSVSTTNSTITIYVQCSQLNFTSMTSYESNLNSLFTSIVDSAPIYNFNKFETTPQSDVVYGLFQCRGDLTSPNCKDCVANAISQLKTTCPMSIGGEIQLEGCLVKYDNSSFFGVQEKVEVWRRCGPSVGYNLDVMNRINGALGYLIGGNGQYFRGGAFGSIQGAAQCVQDLSLGDCQDCLLEACGRLRTECETSTWGDMYMGKCYIRYADQGNENLANNDNSGSKSIIGGSKKNIIKWIAIVIVVAVGVGSLTFAVKNCCNINGTLLSLARLKHLQRCGPKPKSSSGSPFPDHQVMR